MTRRVEQRVGIVLERGPVLLGLGGGLPFLQFFDRLLQHLWVLQQVVADDALDLAALCVGNGLGGCGGAAEREQDRGSEGKGR